MGLFDAVILHFFNQFAHRSLFADKVIWFISDSYLTRGVPVIAILWWAWFRGGETKARDREFVLSGIFMSGVALFVARALAILLPIRERPLQNPPPQFHMPFGVSSTDFLGWSAFPSDHAVFFFALATSIYFVSRKVGIATHCYVLLAICLPRLYLGVHYPTDILAGAVLGIGIACLSLAKGLRTFLTRLPLLSSECSPGFFYPGFFIVTFFLATNFDPLRVAVVSAAHAARIMLHHHP